MFSGCASKTPQRFVADPGRDYSRGLLHRVRPGDTLSEVAWYYNRGWQLLARLNDIEAPHTLSPDEFLYIPPDNSDRVLTQGVLTMEAIRLTRRLMAQGETPAPLKLSDNSLKSPVAAVATAPTAALVVSDPTIKTPAPSTPTQRPVAKNSPKPAVRKPTSAKAPTRELVVSPPVKGGKDFIWPVSGQMVSDFFASRGHANRGVDIAAPSGTPIKAAKAGQVLFTGSMPNLGKMVWIDHGQGFVTLYAHTSENLVSMGDRVKKSQTIALVGDTGKAEDPRLHFQLRHNGQAVDPREYLPPVEGNRVD